LEALTKLRREAYYLLSNPITMKRSYIALIGALLFVFLLIGNMMFKVSPESNTTLAVFIGIFLLLFFLQMRKEKRT